MQTYDQIVVGAGIGGMTLAALLALAGRKVLLLEKAPRIGGSMQRFSRRGIPFDTGFHFTGGLADEGLLADMLRVLGLEGVLRADPVRDARDNRFVFEQTGRDYALPAEYEALKDALKSHFPDQRNAIDRYFELIERVSANTVSMDLRTITHQASLLPEDRVSLAEGLNELTDHDELKALLAAYGTCYGVPAGEVSFANHGRVCHQLYRSIARVKEGGGAFAAAWGDLLQTLNVEVRCSSSIVACEDIRERRVGRFVLSSGGAVGAEDCIFTIHPHHLLDLLPRKHLFKAFVDRVAAFEPSLGFFALYGVVHGPAAEDPFAPAIISLLPFSDMPRLLHRNASGDRVAVIMKHCEESGQRAWNVLTALEASEPADVAAWKDSLTGRRPEAYYAYKQKRRQNLERRVLQTFPQYEGRLEVLETASMLTFRDYLHSRWGCAYGIRQKMGQISLFGRLPLRNLHAAGQSAVLPGVLGAMLASFLLARSLIGREAYGAFIERRLSGASGGGRR